MTLGSCGDGGDGSFMTVSGAPSSSGMGAGGGGGGGGGGAESRYHRPSAENIPCRRFEVSHRIRKVFLVRAGPVTTYRLKSPGNAPIR